MNPLKGLRGFVGSLLIYVRYVINVQNPGYTKNLCKFQNSTNHNDKKMYFLTDLYSISFTTVACRVRKAAAVSFACCDSL